MSDADTSLGTTVASTIRQWVADGRLRPGQHLSEKQLTEQLAVSRNTLREAFRLLSQQGLLTHIPNAGVLVARPDPAAIIDIYRVRCMIERQAIANAKPQHPAIEQMEQAIAEARDAQRSEQWRAVGSANIAFHRALVRLSDSPRITAIHDQLCAELRLAFGLVEAPGRIHVSYIETNQAILEQIKSGDNQRAAERLDAYLEHSERSLLADYKG